ncbi:MAG: hypothetical protein OEV28_13895 [Nitrospirota bacterium]|nr:hypothetical protein [Nitrospirota bacterium]
MMAVMEKSLYEHLAGLLQYPKEDIKERAEACMKALSEATQYPPEVLQELSKFTKDLMELAPDDIQGVYSYTFEFSADYTLDLGYHLFDGFRRSAMLSSLKSMYLENGFPFDEVAKGELPDNLPVILYFMGFVKDEALKKNVRQDFVIKAVEKLNKNFEKNTRNLYRHLISSVYMILDKDVKEEGK